MGGETFSIYLGISKLFMDIWVNLKAISINFYALICFQLRACPCQCKLLANEWKVIEISGNFAYNIFVVFCLTHVDKVK